MQKVRKDKGIYYFEETELEKENRILKQAVAELQTKIKQQDKTWKPQYEVSKEVKQ
jgi:hypothetical protein